MYPHWAGPSEVAAVAGVVLMLGALPVLTGRLYRFARDGRFGAFTVLAFASQLTAIALAVGLFIFGYEAHNDHASGGAAIGWMILAIPTLFGVAGPVYLVAWFGALIAGDRAADRKAALADQRHR